jgi:hypothetical protein
MADDGSTDDQTESSSDDSTSGANAVCVQLSEDDVQGALTAALQAKDVAVDDDGVKVNLEDGLYHLMVRISRDGTPLPQVPDDTSNLAPGSVQQAHYLLQGAVMLLDGACRVTMRLVSVETSEILETGKGDASASTADAVQAAAEDAVDCLPTLHQ